LVGKRLKAAIAGGDAACAENCDLHPVGITSERNTL
jgi:hypothetical protein